MPAIDEIVHGEAGRCASEATRDSVCRLLAQVAFFFAQLLEVQVNTRTTSHSTPLPEQWRALQFAPAASVEASHIE